MRNKRRGSGFETTIKVFIGVVAVLVVGGGIAAGVSASSNQETQTCTVEEKDRSTNSDGASTYRIYTDCGVFSVADNIFFGQWNSADTYSGMKVGTTYSLDTVGFRNGMLSIFPNILKATPVS